MDSNIKQKAKSIVDFEWLIRMVFITFRLVIIDKLISESTMIWGFWRIIIFYSLLKDMQVCGFACKSILAYKAECQYAD